MNSRPSLWFSASTASNKWVTLAAYHDLAATGVVVPDARQLNGVVWRYRLKDLYSSLFYRLNWNFLLPPPDISAARLAVQTVGAVADPDDPLPQRGEWPYMIRKAFKRLKARTGL